MGILAFDKIDESGNIGTGLRRVYKVTFRVTTDDVRVTIPRIAFDRRCPKYNDRYKGVDNLAFANDIDVSRVQGSKFHWTVVVTYDSEVEVHEDELDPLRRKPKTSLDAEFYSKEGIKDRNGLYYMNMAGDPIQGIEVDCVRWKIKFERNIPIDFPSWILDYANKLNNAPIKIRGISWPKNSLRITAMGIGPEDNENDVDFCSLAMEFTHDEFGWKRYLINQGFNELRPLKGLIPYSIVNGKKYRIKERILIKGEPPAEPVFLDKDGSRIHDVVMVGGRPTVVFSEPPSPKDIVVLERDPYYEVDYSKLPLK